MRPLSEIAQLVYTRLNKFDVDTRHARLIPWDQLVPWKQKEVEDWVAYIVRNPDSSEEEAHESWRCKRLQEGWKCGGTFDEEGMIDPLLVPWASLDTHDKDRHHIRHRYILLLTSEV